MLSLLKFVIRFGERSACSRGAPRLLLAVPNVDPVGVDAGCADALSSASSVISFRRLDDTEGVDAVCSGNEAAKEVSFRPSGVDISSSVSYGEYFSITSWKCTAVRATHHQYAYRWLATCTMLTQ